MQNSKTTDTKLYIPTVTLWTGNSNKLWYQLKTGFKRTGKWNKYRSKMINQAKNDNSNYLIDPTLIKSIDYLSYHLKMKVIELFFHLLSIEYSNKELQCIDWWKKFFWHSYKK